ncbi:MAG: tRNA epoxyqueuosine(34) reductase QueG [Tannerellaceae bacterium]
MNLSTRIKQEAIRLGFAACGIAEASVADSEVATFDRWIADGCHAGMRYMENYRDIRLNPAGLVEDARSVISVALNYYPETPQAPDAPQIARYAYGKDYHLVVKDKLRALWQFIEQISDEGCTEHSTIPTARLFTDSAPILERYWAWKAGLGWIGKNTHLIIPGKGSYFFLGEIITTLQLSYDTPQTNRCGRCTRCLEVCPTGALEHAYRLNANKCLSYLTIECRDMIPEAQAAQLGNRLYGCDTCQEACPWNRFAQPTAVEAFRPHPELLSLTKEHLQMLTREEYNRIFAESAVKRTRYEGLMRTINQLKG